MVLRSLKQIRRRTTCATGRACCRELLRAQRDFADSRLADQDRAN